jgi:hypothetical protein
MFDQSLREEAAFRPALPQMPQQAPPVDRTTSTPGAVGDTPGIEANGILGGLGQLVDNLFPF